MPPLLVHGAKTVAYLACTAVGAILGRATANVLYSLLPIPAGTFFAMICMVAALLVGFAAPLEQRLLWGRWLTPSDADLKWIGRSSGTLLSGSIPVPITLGSALGMLSLLVG